MPGDVSKASSVTALFDFIQTSFGRLDIAFNNAGIDIESGKLADGSEDVFDKIMNVNVKGVWLCMQHEIQMMLKNWRWCDSQYCFYCRVRCCAEDEYLCCE